MTARLPAENTFTIVLIGGSAELMGGGEIDTRLDYRNDQFSTVTHQVAANSTLWWETVESLVLPIIESDDHLSQATIFGQRTVRDRLPSGKIKGTRLSSLLQGNVVSVKEETVAQPFPDATWLLSDYQLHAKRRLNPDLRSQLFASTDDSIFTIDYDSQDLFASFAPFAENGSVLIVPHTRLAERFLDAYSALVNLGRPPEIATFLKTHDEENLGKVEPPIAVDATFEITGIFTSQGWQEPTALEAARRLKKQRFDLTLGIWDLVNDDVLRTSLLDQEPLERASDEMTDLPDAYEARVRETLKTRKQSRDHAEAQRQVELNEVRSILEANGWTANQHRDNHYTYPLAAIPHEYEEGPALRFDIYLGRGSTSAYLASDHTEIKEYVIAVVDQKQADLQAIYTPSEFDESATGAQIWRMSSPEGLETVANRIVELRLVWERELAPAIQFAKGLEAQHDAAGRAIAERSQNLEAHISAKLIQSPGMEAVVLQGLGDESHRVREQALELLESLAPEEVEVFKTYAMDDPHERVRETAVRRLVRDEQTLVLSAETLVKVIGEESNEDVRRSAVNGYFQSAPPNYIAALKSAVEDNDPYVVQSALSTLRWLDKPEPLSPSQIERLARHDNNSIREELAGHLSVLNPTETRMEILKALAVDASPSVREAALEALTSIAQSGKKVPKARKTRSAQPTVTMKTGSTQKNTIEAELRLPVIDDLNALIADFKQIGQTTKESVGAKKLTTTKEVQRVLSVLDNGIRELTKLQARANGIAADIEVSPQGTRLNDALAAIRKRIDDTMGNYKTQVEKLSPHAGTSPPPPPPDSSPLSRLPPPPRPQ